MMKSNMMARAIVKSRIAMIFAAIAVILSACSAADEPLDLTENYEPPEPAPEIDAATIDPCASQFELQRELHGAPDDAATETSSAQGKSLTTQMYWYADTAMIVGFRYAEGETWCNVWNESGVTWDR